MGHYAKIENNVVVQVIVAKADVITERSGEWIKTSYNTTRQLVKLQTLAK